MRRYLLLEGPSTLDAHAQHLTVLLALQGANNEYVWAQSECEQQRLLDTADTADGLLRKTMYRAPDQATMKLLLDTYSDLQQPLGQLQRYCLTEPAVEAALRRTVAKLGDVETAAAQGSRLVREHYECNPYPRWQVPPAPRGVTLKQTLAALPGRIGQLPNDRPLRALVAGCGTGFEPIDIITQDPSLAVTAIDLSLTSLCYGLRKAQQLGLNTIEFYQGDILALPDTLGEFDLVVCSGVLHHMADPVAGLKALQRRTRAGGVLHIALYSEIARRQIVAARTWISELALDASGQSIREFRARLQAADQEDFTPISDSDDFLL